MKLNGEILESNNPTEIPAFVNFKELPDSAEQVNAIHVTKNNHSAFFIRGNSYYVLMKNVTENGSTEGEEHFSQTKPFSDIIEEAGNGNFMGFQPSLSPDTFLLLKGSAIYPIQFVANEIRLNPAREVVRQDANTNGMMWAVREIADNVLAVGYFSGSNKIDIYVGNNLQRSIEVGMKIFGFIVPPVRETDQTPADDGIPRRLIALDNGKYCVIDLQAPSEN